LAISPSTSLSMTRSLIFCRFIHPGEHQRAPFMAT
jgi:hypothetical protein